MDEWFKELLAKSHEEIMNENKKEMKEFVERHYLYCDGSDTEDEREMADEMAEKVAIEYERKYLENKTSEKVDRVEIEPDFCCYDRETDLYFRSLVEMKEKIENMTDIFDITHLVRWTTEYMEWLLMCCVMPLSYYENWTNDLKPYFQNGKSNFACPVFSVETTIRLIYSLPCPSAFKAKRLQLFVLCLNETSPAAKKDLTTLQRKLKRRLELFEIKLKEKESMRLRDKNTYHFVDDREIPELNEKIRIDHLAQQTEIGIKQKLDNGAAAGAAAGAGETDEGVVPNAKRTKDDTPK